MLCSSLHRIVYYGNEADFFFWETVSVGAADFILFFYVFSVVRKVSICACKLVLLLCYPTGMRALRYHSNTEQGMSYINKVH